MPKQEQHIWDLWIADVGATGISFARGRLDATDVMIVHAAPDGGIFDQKCSLLPVVLSRHLQAAVALQRRNGSPCQTPPMPQPAAMSLPCS